MMLVQHVAMIEAYLSDRLITLLRLPEVTTKLVAGHRSLHDQKYPLGAIAANPNLLNEKITLYLKSLMYHELDFIAGLYKSALDLSIFQSEEAGIAMKAAMVVRHHCVHRDGKDNDGNVVPVDSTYIQTVRGNFAAMVEHIETQAAPWVDRLPR